MPKPQINVKHNKKKNVGLIFEFLTTQLTKSFLEENQNRSNSIIKILKRHYSKNNTIIHEENKCYDTIVSTRCNNVINARKIVDVVVAHRARNINENKLEQARQHLVRDINNNLGKSFWKQSIEPAIYKTYASAYKVLNYTNKNNICLEGAIDLTNSKGYLLEYLTKAPNNLERSDQMLHEALNPKDEPIVHELLTTRFYQLYNDKYKNSLTEAQRNTLTHYFMYLSNHDVGKLTSKINHIKEGLKIELKNARVKVGNIKDDSVKNKFYEALNKYDQDVMYYELNEDSAESLINNILSYQQLEKEIKRIK